MGKIIIIDDDKEFSIILKNKLQIFFNDEVTVFNEVNYGYLNRLTLDLIFLDIEMEPMNGIDLAKILKLRKDNPLIIFVSSKEDLIHNSLEIQPFYFIRKNKLELDLTCAFSLLKSFDFRMKRIVDFGDKTIDVSQLYYVESDNHYLTFNMKNEEVTVRMTMEELSKVLTEYLCVRVHRSFMINLQYVNSWYSNRVVLKNGAEIDIGRKYQANAKKVYQESKLNGLV